MISDISIKCAAKIQLSIYSGLNQMAKDYPRFVVVPSGLVTSLVDIFVDTVKVPAASLENGVFSLVNLFGHRCFKSCSLDDGYQSFKTAGFSALYTAPVVVLAIPKFAIQCYKTVNNSEEARSYNDRAAQEARFQPIVYPKQLVNVG